MSRYQYLQLQPVEPDEVDSPLDTTPQDDVIDLNQDEEQVLDNRWAEVMDKLKSDIDSTVDDAA